MVILRFHALSVLEPVAKRNHAAALYTVQSSWYGKKEFYEKVDFFNFINVFTSLRHCRFSIQVLTLQEP